MRERRTRVSKRELDEAEHPAVARLRDADPLHLGPGDRAFATWRAPRRSGRGEPRRWRPETRRAASAGRAASSARSGRSRVARPPPSSLPATRADPGNTTHLPLPRGRSAPSRHAGAPGRPRARGRRPPTSRAGSRRATSGPRRAATRPAIVRAEIASSIVAVGMPRPVLNCMQPYAASARQRRAASPAREAARTASSPCSTPRSMPAAPDASVPPGRGGWSPGARRLPQLPRAPRGRARPPLAGLAWTPARRARTVARSLPGAAAARARSSKAVARSVSPARLCMSAAMNRRRRASSGLEAGVSRSACSARSAAAAGAPRTCAVRAASSRTDGDLAGRARPWRARGGALVLRRSGRSSRAVRAATGGARASGVRRPQIRAADG